MSRPDVCARCGSDRVVRDATLRPHGTGWGLDVRAKLRPKRLLFTSVRTEPLRARLCVECGHLDLYVEDTAEFAWLLRKREQLEATS